MTSYLGLALAPLLSLAMLSGCALTKDRFRGIPTLGQSEEQRLRDQDECNNIALANKGHAGQADAAMAAMGAGAALGAAIGASLASPAPFWPHWLQSHPNAAGQTAAGAASGAAAAALLAVGIVEVERRGIAIYVTCMETRGYTVGE